MALRDYQSKAIENILQEFANGVNHQVIVLATGLGKEQPLWSKILTPTGWKTMAEICVGSLVIGSDGLPHRVTGVYPQGLKQIYRVEFSDKTVVECGKDHLWHVFTKSQKQRKTFSVKSTNDLINDLYDKKNNTKWFVPLVKPISFEAKNYILHPYVMGVLIANGSLTEQPIVSLNDPEMIARFSEFLPEGHYVEKLNDYDYEIKTSELQKVLIEELKRLDLLGKKSTEKYIPKEYLLGSVEQRIDLLRGLMDCDPYYSDNSDAPEYTTASSNLAHDITELIRSLGGVTNIKIKEKTQYSYNGETKTESPCYKIRVNLNGINPYYLPRKKDRYNNSAKQEQTKAITSITKLGFTEQKCIMVDSPDHLYVTDGYTLTHNTYIFSQLIHQIIQNTNKKALIIAHQEKLLTQARDELAGIAPDLNIQIEQAEKHANSDAQVVIASVQTIGRSNSDRISKLNPKEFAIVVTDECLTGDTLIQTEDGEKTIKHIVSTKYSGKALALKDGVLVKRNITDWFEHEPSNPIKKVSFSQFQKSLTATTNHKIDTVDLITTDFKQTTVGELKVGDYVATYINRGRRTQLAVALNKEQQSLLYAMMLGDGSITNNKNSELARLKYSQTKANKLWFNEKIRYYKNIGITEDTSYSGYKDEQGRLLRFQTKSSYQIAEMKKQFKLNMRGCLDTVGVQGLAWFFGDDGSVRIRINKTGTITYTAKLNTQNYNLKQNKAIQEWLRNKFDLIADIAKEHKKDGRSFFYLSFKTKEAYKLSELVAKYLTQDMQYKLHPDHRGRFIAQEPMQGLEYAIDRVLNIVDQPNQRVYNITVEKEHHYFANGIYVHNCHHASTDTYKNTFRYLGLLKEEPENDWNKECLLLGVTATPSRSDNKGIEQIFEKVTFKMDIIEGIEANWLSRIKAWRVKTNTSLAQVKTTAGDFNLGELADAVDNKERNYLIVKEYLNRVAGKKALCFCVSVKHAQEIAKAFNNKGVKAMWIAGTTPEDERKQIYKDFEHGDINVLTNAMLLTEGYNCPSIQAILMARPTQSSILYQQMIGRGTRKHPDKEYLTVIDFVDNSYRNRLQSSASLLGIDQVVDFKGGDILFAKKKIDELLDLAPNVDLEKIDIDKIDYAIEEVDLTSGLKVPSEVETFTTYDWQRYNEDNYKINLGNNHYVIIERDITEHFVVKDRIFNKETKEVTETQVNIYPDLRSAVLGADRFIATQYTEALRLIDTSARWRNMPPSDGQLKYLRQYGVNEAVISTINKGEASRLLDKLFSRQYRARNN